MRAPTRIIGGFCKMEQIKKEMNIEEFLASDDRALQQEVLHEVCCITKSKIIRYMDSNGILTDDRKNPMVVIYWELVDIANHIISYEYDDQEKLDEVQGFLRSVNRIMSKLKAA
jgi:hypothetical protein